MEKDIVDEVIGTGRFQGTAHFTRQGDALNYVETGVLTPPGTAVGVEAERRYIWREIQGWIAIAFEDGRPFHAFPVGVLDPDAVHLCDPDRYEVAYTFGTWPEWTVVWDVSGPRKAYKLTVRYWRP